MYLFKCRMKVIFSSVSLAAALLGSTQVQAYNQNVETEHFSSKSSAFNANYAILPGHSQQDAAAIVHNNFAAVIEENFARADAAHSKRLLDNLSERELRDLAVAYSRALGGRHAHALDSLAQKLDGKRLARVAHAFGYIPVSTAVSTHASPEVQVEFEVNAKRSAVAAKAGSVIVQAGAPTIDMTLYEVYLEFRTAPIGSLGPTASIAETAIFAGAKLSWAGAAGYAIGTGINSLINSYAPQLGDAIGGTIYNMAQNISTAGNRIEQGRYEGALDSVLGSNIESYGDMRGDYSGDFHVSRSFNDFMHNGKFCRDPHEKTGAGEVGLQNFNCDPAP
ncbi:hypothetical protein AAKU55_003922 [Oxalobacteraceae bacterium GrIS 1.11]